MRYYGIGTKEVTRKDENGKKVKMIASFVIDDLPNTRLSAENEAVAIAKKSGMELEGLYHTKQVENSGGVMAKRTKDQRNRGTWKK